MFSQARSGRMPVVPVYSGLAPDCGSNSGLGFNFCMTPQPSELVTAPKPVKLELEEREKREKLEKGKNPEKPERSDKLEKSAVGIQGAGPARSPSQFARKRAYPTGGLEQPGRRPTQAGSWPGSPTTPPRHGRALLEQTVEPTASPGLDPPSYARADR